MWEYGQNTSSPTWAHRGDSVCSHNIHQNLVHWTFIAFNLVMFVFVEFLCLDKCRGKTRKYNKATNQLNGRRDSAITLSTRPLDFDLCLRMGREIVIVNTIDDCKDSPGREVLQHGQKPSSKEDRVYINNKMLQTVTRVDQDFDIRRVQLGAEKYLPTYRRRKRISIPVKTAKKKPVEDSSDEMSPPSAMDTSSDSDSEKPLNKRINTVGENRSSSKEENKAKNIEVKEEIEIKETETKTDSEAQTKKEKEVQIKEDSDIRIKEEIDIKIEINDEDSVIEDDEVQIIEESVVNIKKENDIKKEKKVKAKIEKKSKKTKKLKKAK
ncbi:hypothetical protein J6590_054935 [Homalodisca vitripennis]|nr:hypothetical protein J6590_054935 [Homalodisca vitripennis]